MRVIIHPPVPLPGKSVDKERFKREGTTESPNLTDNVSLKTLQWNVHKRKASLAWQLVV